MIAIDIKTGVEAPESPTLDRPKIWDDKYSWTDAFMTNPPKGDPWETLKKGIDKYDKEMCDAWNGELDTILTFTGLFSAAVTAFCIESFHALSQSSTDTTNMFLLVISQQLANSTAPAAAMSMVEGFTPNASDVHINVLYFVSLALALSVSSVCILGKQWIREYQKDLSVSPCDAVRVRQARFDSLEAWKVPQIMAALPVILLIALMLFFSGLLIQLWNVNSHTTAIVVSVVISMTVLLVIITTIVPACVSMQPRRSSFAPFRSPQAWIFFIVFRKIQIWFDAVFDVWTESPHMFSSWSESDLHFLRIETERWFGHSISSVHRALRWIFEVFRHSSEMEQSFLWCLQAKFHPANLIESDTGLAYRVLLDSNYNGSRELDLIYDYDFSKHQEERCNIDNLAGQYQAGLLLQLAHHAVDTALKDSEEAWRRLDYSCYRLSHCGVFNKYLDQDVVHYQNILQDQIAVLYERMFSISPPSHSFGWYHVILLLLTARRDSPSPLSRHIFSNIINQHIPTWIRRHKSVPLLHAIGKGTLFWSYHSWEQAIELFTRLDKVMVEMCGEPEGVEGLGEKSVEKWRELRLEFIQKARTGEGVSSWIAPKHLQLSDGYFERLSGHGALSTSLIRHQLSRPGAVGEPKGVESAKSDVHT